MSRSVLRPVTIAAAAALALVACAAPSSAPTAPTDVPPSSATTGSASAPAEECTPETLQTVTADTLTVSTSKPAYPPYVIDDDPSNGKGFESALAYAVADELGYATDQVTWEFVTFEQTFAPGAKTYDFGLQQVSITPKRARAIDFSDPYYQANQAVVALKRNTKATAATSITALKDLKLGVQVGTTSLDYVNAVVQPNEQVQVFNDTDGAKQALKNGTIDALVVDLPTAFYITAAEINNSVITGQFREADQAGDEWGLVLAKGSPLLSCVNQALNALKDSGVLAELQETWLSSTAEVPFFTE